MTSKREIQSHEPRQPGFIARTLSYMRQRVQDMTAPPIPEEDKAANQALRARIVQTPEYHNQVEREAQAK